MYPRFIHSTGMYHVHNQSHRGNVFSTKVITLLTLFAPIDEALSNQIYGSTYVFVLGFPTQKHIIKIISACNIRPLFVSQAWIFCAIFVSLTHVCLA